MPARPFVDLCSPSPPLSLCAFHPRELLVAVQQTGLPLRDDMNLAEHQRSTSRRRDQLKCYRCRQDKQKCSPTERDWTTRRQEKCKRCQTAGYECGPPETSARKHRFKKTTPEGSPKPIACAPKLAPHVMSLSLEQGRVQSPVLVATTASARVPCTEHIQQVVWDIGGPDTISLDAAMNLLATRCPICYPLTNVWLQSRP